MSADPVILGAFSKNVLFSDFEPDELERLAGIFFLKAFATETPILAEEEPNEGLGVVIHGSLHSSKNVPGFGAKELSRLQPGDIVGEVSFVDELPHAASIRCADDAILALTRRADARKLLEDSVPIRLKLYKIFTQTISRHLRNVNDRLNAFFQQDSAAERIPDGAPPRPGARLGFEKVTQLLRTFDLFASLSAEEIELLALVIDEVPVDKDQVIFREGSRGETLFVVAEGAVRVSKFFAGFGEEALTIVNPGEFFGDMSVFDDLPRSATAIGNAPGTLLLSIGRSSIGELCELNLPGGCRLYEILARIQCRRLRNTINTVSFWQILTGGSDGAQTLEGPLPAD
ncbi:MAG: cyclic nucleotide-binding domain-containing protein [Acidobacteriota bacterium]